MTLTDVHHSWAYVTIFANAAAGCWALGAHWLPALRRRQLWWFVIVAELTIFVQVALGVAIVEPSQFRSASFHMFYGFVAVLTVGLLFAYRQSLVAWMYLLYGLGGLFLMGLCIRALVIKPN